MAVKSNMSNMSNQTMNNLLMIWCHRVQVYLFLLMANADADAGFLIMSVLSHLFRDLISPDVYCLSRLWHILSHNLRKVFQYKSQRHWIIWLLRWVQQLFVFTMVTCEKVQGGLHKDDYAFQRVILCLSAKVYFLSLSFLHPPPLFKELSVDLTAAKPQDVSSIVYTCCLLTTEISAWA